MGVVLGQIVRHPRQPRVHVPAAQVLGRHDLAGRRLHQRRPGEEDRPLIPHDDRDIRHGRHIGPARRAGAHDHRDLWYTRRAHPRLIVEDAPEMVAVREDLVLVRQVRPARVHKVDAGQVALLGDLLSAEVLADGHRVVGAALHGGVVADHHDVAPMHSPHPGDHAGAGRVPAIQPMRRRRPHLEERRSGIEQPRHPLARQHLAARHMPRARPFAPARRRQRRGLLHDPQHLEMPRAVGRETLASGQDGGHKFHWLSSIISRPSSASACSPVSRIRQPAVAGPPPVPPPHCARS
jgi:hypothetical protein